MTTCPNSCEDGILGARTHKPVRCFSRACPHAPAEPLAAKDWRGRA